jgi:acetoin utilization deacetylase AcuC-like enzyme
VVQVAGRARHAFCATRPPGHHAGPSGLVPDGNDPNSSHGFCLLSNVALGAAYARAKYGAVCALAPPSPSLSLP